MVARKHLVDTVADLTSTSVNPKANLKDGQQITVAGYYVAGDKEAVTYVVTTIDPGAANGGTILEHDDGDVWFLLKKNVVTARDFGAVGDDIADDTLPIQAALDSSRAIKGVHGVHGDTYRVTKRSGLLYALLWKSGMRWFGNGSVIKLADSQYPCSLIMSEHNFTGADTTSDTILDGDFDGNEQNQGTITVGGSWYTPTLYLNYINTSKFNIRVTNFMIAAFYSYGDDSENYDNELDCAAYSGRGDGVDIYGKNWTVGTSLTTNAVHVDITGGQANPFRCSIRDSTVERIIALECEWGVKIQEGTQRLNIGSAFLQLSRTDGSPAQAFKLQGKPGNRVKHVNVGQVTAIGYGSNGLYCYEAENCAVGTTLIEGCGWQTFVDNFARADVGIVDCAKLHLGVIKTSNNANAAERIAFSGTNTSINYYIENESYGQLRLPNSNNGKPIIRFGDNTDFGIFVDGGGTIILGLPTRARAFDFLDGVMKVYSSAAALVLGLGGDVKISRLGTDLLGMATGDSFSVEGAWNGGTMRIGAAYLWLDGTNLRAKNGAPSSASDGVVVADLS